MPDQEAPESQDTPSQVEESAPEEGTPEESTEQPESDPFEKRYNDLRPEYDRKSQTLSQYEEFFQALSDPETQAEALQAIGLELEGDEESDEEGFDYDDDPDERIEQIEAYLAEQEEAAQEEAVLDEAEEHVAETLSELDPDDSFSDDYVDLLISAAPEDDDGFPDVKAAHEQFQREFETQREKWVESKRRAPQVGSGSSPSHQPDLDNAEQRRDYIAQRLGKSDLV